MHVKTHSSASDYMEFECDRPVVGYSPSHQRVTPKQGGGDSTLKQFKERLAQHHNQIQHNASANYQNKAPATQSQGNFSHRPQHQKNADIVSEYNAIGN